MTTERTIKIRVDAGDGSVQVKKLDAEMRDAGQSADKLNAELLGLSNDSMPKLSKTAQGVQQSISVSSRALGGFGRTAGQAGIQVQQLVGQVTEGQNAFVAFSQQSADLGFVLGVPLLGAIVAIGASIAGVLAPSLLDSENAIDDLDQAIERLGNTALLSDQGIAVLSDELANLAKNSEIAAQARIAAALLDARDAAKAAAAGIEDAFDNGVVDAFLFDITALTDEIRSGLTSSLVGLTANALRPARLIGEAFGETGKEATALGIEIGQLIVDLEKVGDVKSIDALQNRLSELALGSAATNKEALKFIGSIQEFFSKARDAAEITEFLTQAQKNLGAALQTNTETSASLINRINQELAIQKAELTDGAQAAELLRIAFANGNESIKELPQSLRETAIELFKTKEQIKALAEEERKAEQARRDAARQAEREVNLSERDQARIDKKIALLQLETQTIGSELALQQAVRQGFLTQEQADLDLQTATKIQKAITERELLLAEKNITDEQILAAEDAFQANMQAIAERYREQKKQADEVSVASQAQFAQQLFDIQVDSAITALNAVSSFTKQGSKIQKALFITTKGIQAAQAYTSGLTAAMLARATIPFPYSEPIAAAQITNGKVSAAAILATGFAGAFGGGGGVGSSTGVAGGASAATAQTLPTTPTAAPNVQTLEIVGLREEIDRLEAADGFVPTQVVAKILDKIDSANRLRGEG